MPSDDVLSQIAPWRRTLDCQRGIAAAVALLLAVFVAINGAITGVGLSGRRPADMHVVFGNSDAVGLVVACSLLASFSLLFVGILLSCFVPDRQISRWTRVSFLMICMLLAVAVFVAVMEHRLPGLRFGQPMLLQVALVAALGAAVMFVAWMTSQCLLGLRFGVPHITMKVAVYCVFALALVAIDWYVYLLDVIFIRDRSVRLLALALMNMLTVAVGFGGYLAIVLPIQRAVGQSLASAENRSPSEPLRDVDADSPEGRRWASMRTGLYFITAGAIVVLITVLLIETVWIAMFDRFRGFNAGPPTPENVLAGIGVILGMGLMAAGLLTCCGAPDRNAARSAYLGVALSAAAIAAGLLLFNAAGGHNFDRGFRFVHSAAAMVAGTLGIAGFVNGVLVCSAMARAFGVTRVGLTGAVYIGVALGAVTFALLIRQNIGNFPNETDFKVARFLEIAAAVVVFGGILMLASLTRSAIRLRDSR